MNGENFRDVGATVNRLLQRNMMKEARLLRSGADFIGSSDWQGQAKRICLKAAKPKGSSAYSTHIGISPKIDCYDIQSVTQSYWLHEVLKEVVLAPQGQAVHLFCYHGTE